MGSCVSKKAGRDGNKALPPVMKEINHALSPVAEEEEEEVKEVVLSETPRLPEEEEEEEEEEEGSEVSSESASVAKEKEKAMAKAGGEQEVEVVKRAVADAPEKARVPTRTASPTRAPPEGRPKPNNKGRARSPSPRRHHSGGGRQQPAPPPRREPAVVSAFGCRSGRFSPSAVRRSQSAREADMALPAKRALIGGNAVSRRWETPTASKRPSPAPSPVHRQAARTPERSRPRVRDVAGGGGGEQNPSVAMECFIFL